MIVNALRLAALPAQKQVAALPEFVHVPDEVALIYDDGFGLVPQLQEANAITPSQAGALRELDQLDAGAPDHDFYAGKLAAARFFAATVLPRLATERKVAEETTLDLMDLPEGGF